MGMIRVEKSKINSSVRAVKMDKILSAVLIMILILISGLNIINPGGVAPRPQTRSYQPEIEFLEIETIIDSNYAVTNIQEKFVNPNGYAIDETFQFQIPAKAFISNFSLRIDSETNYAQIVSSSEGKEKYNEAVVSGSNAGLVEEKDKNIFSYSVSLSPYEEIIVGLRFEQFLEKSLGGYSYIIPFSGSNVGSNIDTFTIDISLKSRLFITDLSVETYTEKSIVSFPSTNEGKITYSATYTTPTKDFIVNYELASPPVNGTMLNYNDGTEEFFFHIFSPQRSDLGGQVMPKEIIFVLDKSGSMSGDKIKQLKNAFKEIINQLQPQDTFNIIMFDSTIEKYETDLIYASENNKIAAVSYINNIYASGSTNINGALTTALDMFVFTEIKMPIIVMLTDGLPTAGETDTDTIRENIRNKNTAKVSIFCLGFGFDVDFGFLKAMSLENFGIAIRIYEGEDASAQITDFYDTISTPLLRGLRFSYSEGAYEVYPTYVEQLFEGAEIVVVGKYNGTSRNITATVTASSWEGKKMFTETFTLEESPKISFKSLLSTRVEEKSSGISDNIPSTIGAISKEELKTIKEPPTLKGITKSSFIPRFWAYAKIRYLLDELAVKGQDNNLVENITDLALAYGFVTPYTSLLVEIVEPEPSGGNYNQPNDGVSSGSEGESEAEAEAEAESESEAEGESEAESEAEQENCVKIYGCDSLLTSGAVGTEIEPKNDLEEYKLDEKTKNESETDSAPDLETEIEITSDKHNQIIVTITNTNEDPSKIYWLGIHFDWQTENMYYQCTNVSKTNPRFVPPGETEYFYLNLEIPSDVNLDEISYDILFQHELQDGWFGGWNDYYWRSESAVGVLENNIDADGNSDDGVAPIVPVLTIDDSANPEESFEPHVIIHELIPTDENRFSPLQPIDGSNSKDGDVADDVGIDNEKGELKVDEASGALDKSAQGSKTYTGWPVMISSVLIITTIIIVAIVLFLRKRKMK